MSLLILLAIVALVIFIARPMLWLAWMGLCLVLLAILFGIAGAIDLTRWAVASFRDRFNY